MAASHWPRPIDAQAWGLSAIGITLFEDQHGVTHAIDWVGATHYPEVADFIEEARRMGVSRKVSDTTDFSRFTAQSTLLLLHPRASVKNADLQRDPGDFHCPCGHDHAPHDDCIGLAWHVPENAGPGTARRTLAQGHAYPVRAPLGTPPEYQLAHFMTVPITCISVIQHPDPTVTTRKERKAAASTLPVLVVSE